MVPEIPDSMEELERLFTETDQDTIPTDFSTFLEIPIETMAWKLGHSIYRLRKFKELAAPEPIIQTERSLLWKYGRVIQLRKKEFIEFARGFLLEGSKSNEWIIKKAHDLCLKMVEQRMKQIEEEE